MGTIEGQAPGRSISLSTNASKSRQATSRKKLLGRLGIEAVQPSTRRYPLIVFSMDKPAGKDTLQVMEATYAGGEGRTVAPLNFTVQRGERVALVGGEAAPISTVLGLLGGALTPQAGEVRWGSSTIRGYFPKDHEDFFDQDVGLITWLRQVTTNQEENFVRSFLGKMLFTRDETLKSARVLSGGEKVRCMLARLMMQAPNVLILDGPTNHLDLEAITALNNSLLSYPGTVLFNSQDVQFVESLASRVLVLDDTKLIGDYGSYDDYAAQHLRAPKALSA